MSLAATLAARVFPMPVPPLAAGAAMPLPGAAFAGHPGDFDFLVGSWSVHNRCLRRRGSGEGEWHEFPGLMRAWSHLNGTLSVDEIAFPTLGYSGATVRTLERASQLWSIYWISSREGRLLPPVTGGWAGEGDDARGEFRGEDTDNGRPVLVHFDWQRRGRDGAHWAQSFSYDDGERWELNWTMEMTRT